MESSNSDSCVEWIKTLIFIKTNSKGCESINKVEFDNGCCFYVEMDGTIYSKNKRILKPLKRAGYYYVSCRDYNGKQHNYLIHRLVAKAYIDEHLDDELEVHHKDKDTSNNNVTNLEVLTREEHSFEHMKYSLQKECAICGKLFTPSPTKRERAKTCSEECAHKLVINSAKKRKRKIAQYNKESMELITIWDSARDIQNKLGYRESNINKCCNDNIKSAYGFIWKYA